MHEDRPALSRHLSKEHEHSDPFPCISTLKVTRVVQRCLVTYADRCIEVSKDEQELQYGK